MSDLSSIAHIRFAPDILRRLGEELNPSPDVGILELVKNSYDADAINCIIELQNIDQLGGAILIKDDGDGMNLADITDKWLVLGESSKSTNKLTRLGRVPAGNKGLGRLAALRMGTGAALTTRPRDTPSQQYDLYIDWSNYDNAKTVEEVRLTIEEKKCELNTPQGTEILLEGLRSKIERMDVKRLARSLILLADPFEDSPHGFKPKLIAPEFSDLAKLVEKRYFEDAEYHLQAKLNEHGEVSAQIFDWKGQTVYTATHEQIQAKKQYDAPPASFDLWVFILSQTSFSARSSTTSVGEVKDWLAEFGGVHIYENGLRVSPYGNSGDDWLGINLQRVRSPEMRPGTNSAIGRIIFSNRERQLIQKTDRSGFIENHSFLELKSFAQDAMEWMHRERLREAEDRRQKNRVEAPQRSLESKKQVEEVIARVLSNAPPEAKKELTTALESYDKARDVEIQQVREDVQLYRTLSTAGITAATFAHESNGNPIKVITNAIRAIERRGKEVLAEEYQSRLETPVNQIIKSIDALGVLGASTLKLLAHEKRRSGRVEIHAVINSILEIFKPFLDGRDVQVETNLYAGSPYLRGSQAAVESIITNLINNSLNAFEQQATKNRKICIKTTVENNWITLRVLDNGNGIQKIDINDIWLPGKTTQPNGTGLGLTIVRDTVKDIKGKVSAIAQGELGGAEIIIKLPILGVEP